MKLIVKGELSVFSTKGIKITPKIISLLKSIDQTGSLNMAIQELGGSYSYAWNLLYKLNCQMEKPLTKKIRGGAGGGETLLTDSAKDLINKYESLTEKFEIFLKEHKIEIS